MPKHFWRELELEIAKGVYEPREDSELLAEAVEKEMGQRTNSPPGPADRANITLLDLGCGSGIISIMAAKAGATVTAVDIDENAVELTMSNARRNGVSVECHRSDLFSEVKGRFDIIAFNAPYLPEAIIKGENEAWAAGQQLEVIRRAVEQVRTHLKEGGALLMAISSLTGVNDVGQILEGNGFKWHVVAERKVPWETLYILKAVL